ncbi:hypothetical protein EGW08_019144 [Elysia chlorotica]|uniref:FCH domain-containing protein n=1 Tax=Elysia chlorotica TaxID=188477 RepID=A0A3S1B0F4_ELYCH|nr:hypothetical protein EGW08_019144 [Elysia chlorotica]
MSSEAFTEMYATVISAEDKRASTEDLRNHSNAPGALKRTSVYEAIFPEFFFGYDGFEELRKFIKQGSEFSKEISVILQERSDAETAYAKSLSKVASKLIKACTNGIG